MSATKSATVESSFSPNTKYPIERLNNFYLRLQVLSQDLNDSLVCITHLHDANKAQFDSVTTSVSNSGGSHQSDEFTNGLPGNLGTMNLDSNSSAQPHTRLPTTGDLHFNSLMSTSH